MNTGTAAEKIAGDQQAQHPAAPSIQLPKGGGAIRGLGEKFAANPVTGTGSMSVPIATSPGRSGFGPQLSLNYDSGSGNGPFGFGWSLSLPCISRKTEKRLPTYLDDVDIEIDIHIDSDVFILSGREDLVRVLVQDANGKWVPDDPPQRTVDGKTYRIRRYRPRIEGLFARIERWTNTADPSDVFWRSISKDNITAWYGRTAESRIADPDPSNPGGIFSWLICQSHDDKGNAIAYCYKAEDSARIFAETPGRPGFKVHERNRTDQTRKAQRYPKCIRYGNRSPYFPMLKADAAWPEPAAARLADDGSNAWMFEAVFDYGEHDANAPTPKDAGIWPVRQDPFSAYRAGFDLRTYRICQRILMFHHFAGEVGVERNCLVQSTDFSYSDTPADPRKSAYSFLKAVTHTAYRRNDDGYDLRSLPSVDFTYAEPIVQDVVEEVDPLSLENLPIGLDGGAWRWTDLHGEGIPGILTEQAGAWFYKRNLSPLGNTAAFGPLEPVAVKPNVALSGAELMDLAGDGQPDVVLMDGPTAGFYEHDAAEGWLPFRPFTSPLNRDLRDPNLKFVDLDGDGHADVLITEDDAFVWYSSLAEEGFGPLRRVMQTLDEEKGPRIVFADGTQSIYLADMSGDGLTDLVRIRNSEICYWPNLGYCRFGAKVTMAFEDENGDSACFDHCRQFDQKRIRLADIDGSGTTDIIYLHSDGVRLYFNQSGNGWSQPRTLKVFPRVDDLVSIVPTDLLGNGTACLVWSSPLPSDARRPMRYVNLMGESKPHLLVKISNNLGAETRVEYAPSTKFYLQDKRDGKPWVTRLPFPVHVVERLGTYDHISRNRFFTCYAYHHGYFDGEDREFRGFGMVDQWDTEQFPALADGKIPADNVDAASHVPPVHTRTWFHTGAYLGRDRISHQFEHDYFREPGLGLDTARSSLLDDTIVPPALSLDEEREACRALKGSMLRQEVYALDGVGQSAEYPSGMPYTVAEQNFTIRTLQRRGANRHAVFFTHAREAITFHYERNAADPRIQHALTLEVDDFGNVLKQAAISYGRRQQVRTVEPNGIEKLVPNAGFIGLDDADRAKQITPLITYSEIRFTKDEAAKTDAVDRDDIHRIPLPCESVTFELTGYAATGPEIGPATDPTEVIRRYQASDFIQPDAAQPDFDQHDHTRPARYAHIFTAPEVKYEDTAAGNKRRRRIEWLRTLYRRDDLSDLLPLGELQPLALPGESYKLAFTPGLLDQVFLRPRVGQEPEALLPEPTRAAVLGGQAGSEGGYVDLDGDGHWWMPSGRSFYHPDDAASHVELAEAYGHFFLPRRYRNPFGKDAVVGFDAQDLLMTETRDELGNRVTVDANDYRVLQPRLVSDPNRNQTEVAFDTLGMVVGTAVMGKPHAPDPEGDSLAGFITDLAQDQLDGIFDAENPRTNAAALLKDATTRVVYDLDRFQRTQSANPETPEAWLPACAVTLARETHLHAPLPPQGLKIQLSFSYSDGFGREIQKKIQAEPGPLADGGPDVEPRWIGSGWTIYNNKGNPVRQFEPFFSKRERPDGSLVSDHRFEFGVTVGVSPVLFYDPAERVIATLHPNHTYEKVKFDPWRQITWDVNDTCAPPIQKPGDPPPRETGDPRTDPDIRGVVAEYFKALPIDPLRPWQTWHAQRIGTALGKNEQRAAELAAAHADTPTTVHFDTLGRPFLTVARNRVVCAGHLLHNRPDEDVRTRVELDIEGNQRKVLDERNLADANNLPLGAPEQRIVMRYAYDMLGNRVHQLSMEAGGRWMLNDVAGKPIRAWDSRGHNFTSTYDSLRRPIEQYVRGTFRDPDPLKPNSDPRTLDSPNDAGLLVDRLEYGEPPPGATPAQEAEAQRLNLRTRVYRHSDSAGVATSARLDAIGKPAEAYDFKGNLLCSTRQLVSDYKAIPDWLQDPPLETETFIGRTRYDALNRPVQSVAPRSSLGRGKFNVIQPVFNEASLLERVDVWLERAAEPDVQIDPANEAPSPVGVTGIHYDAKGQRTLIDYKTLNATVIRTTYVYDRDTLRLRHLYTRRGVDPATEQGVDFTDDCDNPAPPPATIAAPNTPPAGKGCGLQNLDYTYDPAGNVTHIHDDAQQTIYFQNQLVEPSNDYVYDALNRLIQAEGREHLGQAGVPSPHSYNDARRVGILSANPPGRFAPNDMNAMGRYTERYVYDAVGNFLQMQHARDNAAMPDWTRIYTYDEASLIEFGKQSNMLSRTTVGNAAPEPYSHDAHGNMLDMPQLQSVQWDYRDQLQMTQRQKVNDDDDHGIERHGERTWYVYDASGQRVRKVTELANNGGVKEERIYLGELEVFRSYQGAANARALKLERETLHVMDDKQRIAMVEIRTLGNEPDVPQRLIRYQFGNHLRSGSLELDEQAQIISYEEYAPYGSSTYQAVRSRIETPKRYRYTGKERDEESGFYYHGARYYMAWLARWASSDPAGTADGPNTYQYVKSKPTVLIDKLGLSGGESDPPPWAVSIDSSGRVRFNAPALKQEIVQGGKGVDLIKPSGAQKYGTTGVTLFNKPGGVVAVTADPATTLATDPVLGDLAREAQASTTPGNYEEFSRALNDSIRERIKSPNPGAVGEAFEIGADNSIYFKSGPFSGQRLRYAHIIERSTTVNVGARPELMTDLWNLQAVGEKFHLREGLGQLGHHEGRLTNWGRNQSLEAKQGVQAAGAESAAAQEGRSLSTWGTGAARAATTASPSGNSASGEDVIQTLDKLGRGGSAGAAEVGVLFSIVKFAMFAFVALTAWHQLHSDDEATRLKGALGAMSLVPVVGEGAGGALFAIEIGEATVKPWYVKLYQSTIPWLASWGVPTNFR